MAHKKGVGSSDNGRDSQSKRLGVKLFGGQQAISGNIIIRQRGTRFHAGANVHMGKDHTLHASIDGVVTFKRGKNDKLFVHILPNAGNPNVVTATVTAKDDLKKVEGIGPKIAEILNNNGIFTFAQLAATPAETVKEMLTAAGSRYAIHNPTTWGQQAQLAADGKWDELKAWQDELNGGK